MALQWTACLCKVCLDAKVGCSICKTVEYCRDHVYAIQCVKTFQFFEEQRLTFMSSLRSSSSPREEMSMSGSLAVETPLGTDASSSASPARRDALLAAHDKMADLLY